jgi:superfamily II DNA or RNA helicase
MKFSINNYLLDIEASPVEMDWLKSLLTWEDHEGKETSVIEQREDESYYTYSNLLPEIQRHAQGVVDLEIEGELLPKPSKEKIKIDVNCLEGITLRPHQSKAAQKAIRGKQGFLWLPTAAGKTEIMLGIYQNLKPDQCVIMVPTMYLAEEIYSRAVKYGISENEVGILHGKIKQNRKLIIAVTDSLRSSVSKEDQFYDTLMKTTLLMADEGHHLGAETWRNIWWTCPAEYKVAVTATPFNNLEGNPLASHNDAMTCATGGKILYQVSNSYLILKEVIAQTFCLYVFTRGMRKHWPISPVKLHTQMISENQARNEIVLKYARKARTYGLSVLILVSRTKHAEYLMNQLRDYKVMCKFEGSTSLQFDDQTGAIEKIPVDLSGPGSWTKRFENGEWEIVIGTPNMDEGVDTPDIGFTILAGGGKSVRQNIQRRGRGGRKKKGHQPNRAYMVDFMDRAHVYLWHHSRKRRAMFEASATIVMEDEKRFWRLINQHARIRDKKD